MIIFLDKKKKKKGLFFLDKQQKINRIILFVCTVKLV